MDSFDLQEPGRHPAGTLAEEASLLHNDLQPTASSLGQAGKMHPALILNTHLEPLHKLGGGLTHSLGSCSGDAQHLAGNWLVSPGQNEILLDNVLVIQCLQSLGDLQSTAQAQLKALGSMTTAW